MPRPLGAQIRKSAARAVIDDAFGAIDRVFQLRQLVDECLPRGGDIRLRVMPLDAGRRDDGQGSRPGEEGATIPWFSLRR